MALGGPREANTREVVEVVGYHVLAVNALDRAHSVLADIVALTYPIQRTPVTQ
jgi:hypothetical protein